MLKKKIAPRPGSFGLSSSLLPAKIADNAFEGVDRSDASGSSYSGSTSIEEWLRQHCEEWPFSDSDSEPELEAPAQGKKQIDAGQEQGAGESQHIARSTSSNHEPLPTRGRAKDSSYGGSRWCIANEDTRQWLLSAAAGRFRVDASAARGSIVTFLIRKANFVEALFHQGNALGVGGNSISTQFESEDRNGDCHRVDFPTDVVNGKSFDIVANDTKASSKGQHINAGRGRFAQPQYEPVPNESNSSATFLGSGATRNAGHQQNGIFSSAGSSSSPPGVAPLLARVLSERGEDSVYREAANHIHQAHTTAIAPLLLSRHKLSWDPPRDDEENGNASSIAGNGTTSQLNPNSSMIAATSGSPAAHLMAGSMTAQTGSTATALLCKEVRQSLLSSEEVYLLAAFLAEMDEENRERTGLEQRGHRDSSGSSRFAESPIPARVFRKSESSSASASGVHSLLILQQVLQQIELPSWQRPPQVHAARKRNSAALSLLIAAGCDSPTESVPLLTGCEGGSLPFLLQ
ncbi:unnamed protein product [Amoebophrya sp. A25]|nr:unnamed protein product [Amoebophrya sp. A25]|eukprot:GSA25T00000601001.1